jgi:hypothetical protein
MTANISLFFRALAALLGLLPRDFLQDPNRSRRTGCGDRRGDFRRHFGVANIFAGIRSISAG